MSFDFEDRHFDTPGVESAMSWREQVLLSGFAHMIAVLVVLFVPQLSFVKEADARRAAQAAELAAVAEQERQAERLERDEPTFIFVEPLVEIDAIDLPTANAIPSDRDRSAMAPDRANDPTSRLPFAEGNSAELVVGAEPSDILIGAEAEPVVRETPRVEELLEEGDDLLAQVEQESERASYENDLDAASIADEGIIFPGTGLATLKETIQEKSNSENDELLSQAMKTLRDSVRRQTFGNLTGETGRYGPWIQFDTKGVEFGPWIRRFAAQIRRNWFVPYAAMSMRGRVVLTFNVSRDGALTDVQVEQPSLVGAFNNAALNALLSSNPTQSLPVEYPDDQAFFTVTFFYNESPLPQ
jgi:TonB family protein